MLIPVISDALPPEPPRIEQIVQQETQQLQEGKQWYDLGEKFPENHNEFIQTLNELKNLRFVKTDYPEANLFEGEKYVLDYLHYHITAIIDFAEYPPQEITHSYPHSEYEFLKRKDGVFDTILIYNIYEQIPEGPVDVDERENYTVLIDWNAKTISFIGIRKDDKYGLTQQEFKNRLQREFYQAMSTLEKKLQKEFEQRRIER